MSTINASQFTHLSVEERLQLVEDLWDSIAADAASEPGRLPVAAAQGREILRRSEAHRNNPGESVPLDEALDRIERSIG